MTFYAWGHLARVIWADYFGELATSDHDIATAACDCDSDECEYSHLIHLPELPNNMPVEATCWHRVARPSIPRVGPTFLPTLARVNIRTPDSASIFTDDRGVNWYLDSYNPVMTLFRIPVGKAPS